MLLLIYPVQQINWHCNLMGIQWATVVHIPMMTEADGNNHKKPINNQPEFQSDLHSNRPPAIDKLKGQVSTHFHWQVLRYKTPPTRFTSNNATWARNLQRYTRVYLQRLCSRGHGNWWEIDGISISTLWLLWTMLEQHKQGDKMHSPTNILQFVQGWQFRVALVLVWQVRMLANCQDHNDHLLSN